MIGIVTVAVTERPDTIGIDDRLVSNIVQQQVNTRAGNRVIKYYVVYNHEMIPSDRETARGITLAKKYHVRCALLMLIKNKHKRIILN